MPNKKNSVTPVSRRVLRSEFCQHFLEQWSSLYVLALTLTADTQVAEKCFIKAFQDCLNATGVSKGWEGTWARRTVICRAIEVSGDGLQHSRPQASGHSHQDRLAGVMALPRFERFVFVLSVLESYSDQECRVLLECTKQAIVDSRLNALQALALSAENDQSMESLIGHSRVQYSNVEIGAMNQESTDTAEPLSPIRR